MKSLQVVLLTVALMVAANGQGRDRFNVSIHSDVHFVIRNPEGKQSGFNPVINRRFDQINRSYGIFVVDSEDPDIAAPPPVYEFSHSEAVSGEYLLTLFGAEVVRFELYVSMSRTTRDGDRVDIVGVIDSGQTIQYHFNYNRTPGKPYEVKKVIEKESLRQDLDNCYKLQLLGAKPFYIDLSHRVEKYEEWIQKADAAKAFHELDKLDKKLDEVYEKSKGPSKDPNHFIKEDAYRILKEDVMGLMK